MAASGSLFSLYRARGWGRESQTQLEFVFFDGSATVVTEVGPTPPYPAMVIHRITFNHVNPNALNITFQHQEIAQHTFVLSGDQVEHDVWMWVTDQQPFRINVENRLSVPGFLGMTLSTINFDDQDDRKEITELVKEEFTSPDESKINRAMREGFPRT